MYATTPEREQLVADIKHAGFYPDLVLEVVDDALAGMNPDAHFVQHETHFSRDDFHRHITDGALRRARHLCAPGRPAP